MHVSYPVVIRLILKARRTLPLEKKKMKDDTEALSQHFGIMSGVECYQVYVYWEVRKNVLDIKPSVNIPRLPVKQT